MSRRTSRVACPGAPTLARVAAALAALAAPHGAADTIFSSQADLNLWFPLGPATGAVYWSTAIFLGDIDADGWCDFAVVTQLREKDGRRSAVSAVSGQSGATLYTRPGAAPNEFFRECAAVDDLNNDGVREYLISTVLPPRVILCDGASGATVDEYFPPSGLTATDLRIETVGDHDGDGIRDFIARYRNPPAVFVRSTATGEIIRSTAHAASSLDHLRGDADLSGDGGADLIAYGGTVVPDLQLLRGDTFAVLSNVDLEADVEAANMIGDVSGDGIPDIAAAVELFNPAQGVRLFLISGGDGTILGSRFFADMFGRHIVSALGDVNEDGVPDVGFASRENPSSQPHLFVVSGRTGSVLRTIRHDPADFGFFVWVDSTEASIDMARDINDDGRPDLLLQGFRFASDAEGATASVFLTPPACPTDANYDRVVDFLDLNLSLSQYGSMGLAPAGLDADVNHDGVVDFYDLASILAAFGQACD